MSTIAEQIAVMESIAGGRPGTPEILATLRWLEPNAAWIKAAAKLLTAEQKRRRDVSALMQEPAVTELLRHFPEAEVVFRDLHGANTSEDQSHDDEDQDRDPNQQQA